jgi:hypothetical protein
MAYTTINDPSAHFQATIYSGTGSTASVTNGGNSDLQPDLVWLKCRNVIRDHRLMDSTRGVQKELVSNGTGAEYTESTGLTAFQSDGFQHGGANGYGASGETYVSWQWKANGGTRTTNTESGSNPAGGYQANTTAGFSIIDFTGTGANGTMAHGLSSAPELLIVKQRDDAAHDWQTGSSYSTSWAYRLKLNDNVAEAEVTSSFNSTAPTSSVFTIGDNSDVNEDAHTYIAYCFHSVQGYSKFGKYEGNGNADGPFVYTGFKPAMIIKKGTGSGDWHISDNKQNSYNAFDNALRPNTSNGTETGNTVDFLSNGFKIRNTGGSWNSSGSTYIYMAFAEQPFVTSSGVPATAR